MRIRAWAAFAAVAILCHATFTFAAGRASRAELERLFRQGMEALAAGRLKQAQELFQTILSMEPSLHRARLELAVAYYRALDYPRARSLAQQVLEDPETPPEVRVTIRAFLAQIDADRRRMARRHQWSASLELGVLHDSNVNVGPSSEVVSDTIRLLPGSTARTDNALAFSGALNHTWNPGKRVTVGQRTGLLLWQSQLSLYRRDYNDENGYDLSVLGLGTGPALVVPRFLRGKLDLRLDDLYLGGTHLALFASLDPFVTWQFGDTELTVDARLGRRDYRQAVDAGREGTDRRGGLALGHFYRHRQVAVQVGLHWNDFNADDPRWGYDGPEVYLGGQVSAWSGGLLYARAVQQDFHYDAVYDPSTTGLDRARDDRTREFTFGVRHAFRGGRLDGWRLRGELQRTLNGSNLGIFRYDRTRLTLSLARDFE